MKAGTAGTDVVQMPLPQVSASERRRRWRLVLGAAAEGIDDERQRWDAPGVLTRVKAKVQLKVKARKVKVKAQGAQMSSSEVTGHVGVLRGQRQQSVVMTNESMQSLGPSMTATMRA